MKLFLGLCVFVLPFSILRRLLNLLGHEIADSAHIGFSYISAKRIVLKDGATIGHLNIIKNLDTLQVGENSIIGNFNWISAYPSGGKQHFADADRQCALILGDESAITHRHYFDCTSSIRVGNLSTVAGFASQLITHGINIYNSTQESTGILIGHNCFVGTRCVLLGGTSLPNNCVLGAGAVLAHNAESEYCLYAGVPAVKKKNLPKNAVYFSRDEGAVK